MSNINRVKKPKIHNSKSSDRRLASGVRPESFLLSQQQNNLNIKSQSTTPTTGANNTTNNTKPHNKQHHKPNKNFKKQSYGKDHTLDEWDPKHFRLFVGNLGSDANDGILMQSFGVYPSLTKVKVPMDHKNENKGYGFVAFSDPNDYLKAFKELNGKYIGHNPCVLKKANDLKKK
ncbi:Polyadenylate-binding protein, cytoplasmic and nuclear [Wickerhamomyces ciferrii]|uniref:Polyadenylate-binding protein, cytoplasmic and nuclear n=1 Tax=Wickerhamomyces ciferrii (strain ATCC 14091 / BCRC 22168 / CBS 111 / JCM 3599 / NBRC 0793 / NRRL Y-1031 F-60-10) TaxID=1206466 RepID=K0KMN7_WICCF|nr:Polyadenylate-binding protein, cytoplasmic and nuclear [Wickerhamomyces ciferrii]CCH42378.1 Polyadenylate-binding protein, cytoplasmic and nuclear [Wickerhamomyces ciferrii]